MDEHVLALNADISQLSRDLIAQVDETWSDIQQQTVKIIQEATERLPLLVGTFPNGDPEHWLHDLRSPGASMLSAVNLLRDEAEYSPSHLDVAAVEILQDKIIALRAAVDEMANAKQRLSGYAS